MGVRDTIAALRERAGTQFDPECVEALATVADTAHGFALVRADPDAAASPRPDVPEPEWLDHDLPAVSDMLAEGRA